MSVIACVGRPLTTVASDLHSRLQGLSQKLWQVSEDIVRKAL